MDSTLNDEIIFVSRNNGGAFSFNVNREPEKAKKIQSMRSTVELPRGNFGHGLSDIAYWLAISTVNSFQISTAMPIESYPAPRFAVVAGTLTVTFLRTVNSKQ